MTEHTGHFRMQDAPDDAEVTISTEFRLVKFEMWQRDTMTLEEAKNMARFILNLEAVPGPPHGHWREASRR